MTLKLTNSPVARGWIFQRVWQNPLSVDGSPVFLQATFIQPQLGGGHGSSHMSRMIIGPQIIYLSQQKYLVVTHLIQVKHCIALHIVIFKKKLFRSRYWPGTKNRYGAGALCDIIEVSQNAVFWPNYIRNGRTFLASQEFIDRIQQKWANSLTGGPQWV